MVLIFRVSGTIFSRLLVLVVLVVAVMVVVVVVILMFHASFTVTKRLWAAGERGARRRFQRAPGPGVGGNGGGRRGRIRRLRPKEDQGSRGQESQGGAPLASACLRLPPLAAAFCC